jgi:hypothetical protein
MPKHLYMYEKRLVYNFIKRNDYHLIYLSKVSASGSASATRVSSCSCICSLSIIHCDFVRSFIEGPDSSSSINSTSRVANSVSPDLSDIVKLWCHSISSL